MSKLTIKLFNKVALNKSDQVTSEILVTAFNMEAAALGYTFTPQLLSVLKSLGDEEFARVRESLLADLVSVKGAKKKFTVLFNGFPYATPNESDYFEQRVLGQMSHDYGITLGGNQLVPLSCGHVLDSALFSAEDYGVCPICQFQVDELSSPTAAKFDYKSVTPLTPLDVSTDSFRTEGNRLLARKSSLSEDEKTFLKNLINEGIQFDLPDTIYRENLPFAYKLFGDKIEKSLSGATDVLRIASFMSDEKADLSLTENVRFKLTTANKRSLLRMLEGRKNLAEDMLRHREKWLRLGERLNPAAAKNKARFPNVANAFDRLRNDEKKIVTFNRQMEDSMRRGVVDQDFINLMTERAGEFVRKFDYMLRTGTVDAVIAGLTKVVSRVPERTLLDLRKYLASRNDSTQRIFIPKGKVNKMQVVEDKRKPLPMEGISKAIDIIDADLRARYAEKESLGKVFIDPLLKDVLLPYNRRGDSSTSTDISKGSRFAFNGDVVRMFVWWKGHIDVDLSVLTFDENMQSKGYVSYQRLNDDGIVHSGDVQNAPDGASEFIDLAVEKIVKSGVRYVATSLISFRGEPFNTFECFAGFMERDKMSSGALYEPESVKLRFDVNNPSKSATPLLFDLVERKVIFADLSTAGSTYGAVSRQGTKQQALTNAMLSLPDRKPTLFDVIHLNALARGEIVDTPDDADVVYSIDNAKALIEEYTA